MRLKAPQALLALLVIAMAVMAALSAYFLQGGFATPAGVPEAVAERPAADDAAPAPPPTPVDPGPQLMTIPAQFRGEWNADRSDCGTGLNDSRLRIGPQEVSFYESTGRVTEVKERSANDIELSLALAGEGESWVSTYRFKLSEDGNTLIDVTNPQPVERFRCGGR